MKKTMIAVFAIIFAAFLTVSALPSAAADGSYSKVTLSASSDGKYTVDTQGREDVLRKIAGKYNSTKYGTDYTESKNIPLLTDGVYAIEPYKDLYGTSYFNLAWCDKDKQADIEATGGSVKYSLAGGKTLSCVYSFEWKELDVDVSSFSLWFNNDTVYTDNTYSWWQTDSQFAILVSQDGGKTYSVAYESTPCTVEGSKLVSSSSWLKSDGGDWTMLDTCDASGNLLFRCGVCSGDFVSEFKGVTNIVYASIASRRNGKSANPFYYAARISEFDVYGSINSTKYDQTVTTEAEQTTAAPSENTTSPSGTDTEAAEPFEYKDPVGSVTVSAQQADKDSGDGKYYLKVTVTNNNPFAIYGNSVSSDLSSSGGLELEGLDLTAFSKIECGESADILLTYSLSEGEDTGSGGAKKGCRSSVGIISVLCAVIFAAILMFCIKNPKKSAVIGLALLCCLTPLCIPSAASDASGAVSTDTSMLPEVTITEAIAGGDADNYKNLSFKAQYTGVQNYSVETSAVLTDGNDSHSLDVTVIFSDCTVTEYGMLAIPVSGLDTLPLAVTKGGSMDLWETYGTGMEITGFQKEGGNYYFTATYPDPIYTEYYSVNFLAAAYIKYTIQGTEGIARSYGFLSSVKDAAQAKLQDSSLTDEEKEEIRIGIIQKAGTASVLSEETENTLRQNIVKRMQDMAAVKWKISSNIITDGQLNFSTPTYYANKQYSGLIYNQQGYGTAEAFSYLVGDDGYLDEAYTKDVNAIWRTTPGVSCSTAITGAYAFYVDGIEKQVGATNMIPSSNAYGFSKIGDYTVPAGAKTTTEIVKANSLQDIYKGYAEMKAGDILVACWYNSSNSLLGHVLMVTDTPTIVYNDDGTINAGQSKLKTIEQHATAKEVDGCLTTWQSTESTFGALATGSTMKYVPVKYDSLTADYATPLYCMLSGFSAENALNSGLVGTLESNFPIRWLSVTLADESGKTVYDIKYTPDGGYKKAFLLSSLTDINISLKALPSGTYTLTLKACVKGEEKLLCDVETVKN